MLRNICIQSTRAFESGQEHLQVPLGAGGDELFILYTQKHDTSYFTNTHISQVKPYNNQRGKIAYVMSCCARSRTNGSIITSTHLFTRGGSGVGIIERVMYLVVQEVTIHSISSVKIQLTLMVEGTFRLGG